MTTTVPHRTRTLGAEPGHRRLRDWVADVACLTEPDAVWRCNGSDIEAQLLAGSLVRSGTLVRLDDRARPNSFYARTDPDDVARVEDRTFICSRSPEDAGPTNNWMHPDRM